MRNDNREKRKWIMDTRVNMGGLVQKEVPPMGVAHVQPTKKLLPTNIRSRIQIGKFPYQFGMCGF